MPRLRMLALAAASATLAAGCGVAAGNPGSTTSTTTAPTTSAPVLDKPLNQMVGAAISALRGAKSVHLAVSSTVGGSGAYAIFSGGSGTADTTADLPSGTVQLHMVEVGSKVFVRAPAAFWVSVETTKGQYPSTELTTLTSHWVLLSSSSPDSAVIPQLQSTVEEFLGLLGSDTGLTSMGTATVLGTKAQGFRGSVGGLELWVAASGTPYPIELSGASPPTLFTFTDWNVGSPPTAPAGAVDLPDSHSN